MIKEHIKKVLENKIDLDAHFSKVIEQCRAIDKKYDCFITIDEEYTKNQVKALKQKIKNMKNPALAGIAVSVKDCICTKGLKSTAGSKILENYVPPFESTVTRKVIEAGGIIVGKTCMDEFGFGSWSTNCAFKVPKNPIDVERTCGGSSGGAACITKSAEFPHIAIAESTGGSISCPACFCQVYGLTPTYGLVSRYGLIDYANSLDKIGLMSKNMEGICTGLNVIAGLDEKDQTSLDTKEDYEKTEKSVKGLKIGIPEEYYIGLDKKIEKEIWDKIKKLESMGAEYGKASLKTTKTALQSYYIIATGEASTNLAKLCGMRYGMEKNVEGNFNAYFSKLRSTGFGKEAKRRILLGTYSRMSGYRDQYYLKAMKARTLVIWDFKKAFKEFDVLIAPTMPMPAPKFTEIEKLTPLQNYQSDILTVAPNLAGIPMLNIPTGTGGMHVMADHLKEKNLLKTGWALE